MDQKSKDWAEDHGFSLREPTRKIEGQRGFGYPAHRYRSHKSVKLTRGLDNQWKRDSRTTVRVRSSRATTARRARRIDGSVHKLVSNTELAIITRDPIVVAAREIEYKKMKRRHNRNNRARRGHKRSMKMAA